MKSYHDIAGDGGSRVAEQVAEHRARIERSLEGVRRLVAIGSGKGGVGKSTLTMQLALALTRRGRRVAVLDADFNGPSQARLAGLRETPPLPGACGLALPRSAHGVGVVSMGGLVPEPEAVDFDSVSRGESHTWRATQEFNVLGQLLAGVEWGALDFLLFDLPPGAERTRQYAEFLGGRTAFVVVTIPGDLARGVVARSIAARGETGSPILGYVENMTGYCCPGCGEVGPLFPSSRDVPIPVPCLGRVPFDPRLARACERSEAAGAVEDSPATLAIRGVAALLESDQETTT